MNLPLQTIQASAATPEVDSTSPLAITSSANCPANSPANSNCAQYTLVVPASNPKVGLFSSGSVTYTALAQGDVLFTVDAIATNPANGGALSCSPSEKTMSNDTNNLPLKVSPATPAMVGRIDFSSCT